MSIIAPAIALVTERAGKPHRTCSRLNKAPTAAKDLVLWEQADSSSMV